AAARARYDAYNAAVTPFMPPEHHYHVNVLAVRHEAQGRGHARTLLEHVHSVARNDPESSGVSLTTETEANVPLYEHFGYRVLGEVDVAPGLRAWGFFRGNNR
ncbi:MAG TPA: GNAT family N-acetyltransferase, partial [Candidatus Krumholzibacteria bacterium]